MKMVKINRQCSRESATLLKGTELTELCGQNQSQRSGESATLLKRTELAELYGQNQSAMLG